MASSLLLLAEEGLQGSRKASFTLPNFAAALLRCSLTEKTKRRRGTGDSVALRFTPADKYDKMAARRESGGRLTRS